MTDRTPEEQQISQRYRELAREEPPRALDDAILAASRRAAEIRPAPLVVPSGRRRWYFPLAAAAIIVLAVAVTMHVEREQPGEEIVAMQPAAPPEKAQTEEPKPAPEPQPARKPEPQPFAVEPPAARKDFSAGAGVRDAAPAEALAKRADEANTQLRQAEAARPRREVMASAAAPASRLASATPEQWLQGIDDLKRQGRHDEAERELAEFRRRYPNYRIPEAISEKFEKR